MKRQVVERRRKSDPESVPNEVWSEIVLRLCTHWIKGDRRYRFLIHCSWLSRRFNRIVEELVMPQIKYFGGYVFAVVTNERLRRFNSLQKLELCNASPITDDALLHLPQLTSLNIEFFVGNITDKGMENVSSTLVDLSLSFNKRITNKGIQSLTNLRSLSLCDERLITGAGFKSLPSLKILSLRSNRTVSGSDIRKMSLNELSVDDYDELITVVDILSLTTLRIARLGTFLGNHCNAILKNRGVCVL